MFNGFNKKIKQKTIKKPLLNTGRRVNYSDKKRLSPGEKMWVAFKYLLLVLIVLIILYPIAYLVISAFNDSLPNSSLSTTKSFSFSLRHFSYLNDIGYWTWIINSVVIGFTTMILVVIFSGLMAYGFSRFSFAGKKAWIIFILLIGLIPNLLALIVFYVLSDIFHEIVGLPRMIVLILLYSGGGIVGQLYILKSYMDGISSEIDDSAKIDGLSNWQMFLRIIAPLAKPMLSIIAFWSFLAPFGDVILSSLILVDKDEYTVPIGLMTLINGTDITHLNMPAFAAGSLLVSLPIVVTFLILRRNMSSGLAEGGVKG